MSKRISVVVALVGMCALSLFLLNCGSSSSRPSGLLYVLTQGSNGTGNNVSSFAIDLNSGSLSLINSNASTCSTANACGLPLDILLDPTGATAFVLNQGIPSGSVAPTIYGYKINSDGSLGTPTAAVTPTLVPGDVAVAMTRDVGGNFLYVITGGNQSLALAPQLLVFSTTPGSTSLTPVSNVVSTLTRVPTALSAITFPTPSGTTPPCSFTTSEEFLYVTSNHDLSQLHDDSTVSVYCVDSSGNLTETPNSPYATATTDPISVLAVNTNRAGQSSGGGVFVYVGSQSENAGALNVFQMCTVPIANCTDVPSGRLVPVVTQPASPPGSDPVAMLADPTNNFLYVVCYGSNQVFGYGITSATGTLTLLNPPNQPTGSQPVALAMHPSVNSTGQFLYVSNSTSSSITGFTLSTTSGSMSSLITVTSPAGPSGMAAR